MQFCERCKYCKRVAAASSRGCCCSAAAGVAAKCQLKPAALLTVDIWLLHSQILQVQVLQLSQLLPREQQEHWVNFQFNTIKVFTVNGQLFV
jgi:hypothetical protein